MVTTNQNTYTMYQHSQHGHLLQMKPMHLNTGDKCFRQLDAIEQEIKVLWQVATSHEDIKFQIKVLEAKKAVREVRKYVREYPYVSNRKK